MSPFRSIYVSICHSRCTQHHKTRNAYMPYYYKSPLSPHFYKNREGGDINVTPPVLEPEQFSSYTIDPGSLRKWKQTEECLGKIFWPSFLIEVGRTSGMSYALWPFHQERPHNLLPVQRTCWWYYNSYSQRLLRIANRQWLGSSSSKLGIQFEKPLN